MKNERKETSGAKAARRIVGGLLALALAVFVFVVIWF